MLKAQPKSFRKHLEESDLMFRNMYSDKDEAEEEDASMSPSKTYDDWVDVGGQGANDS